jgi:predicted SAM-dependent methyltransferase
MRRFKRLARAAISKVIRNREFHIRRGKIAGRRYLDLGCGAKTHADFINLNYQWNRHLDVCWDLENALPFANESLDGVFTEHCLEHLPLPTSDRVLSECFRVLRPGGTLRLIVPDGELYLSGYAALRRDADAEPLPFSATEGFAGIYTPIMSINRIFREHGHRFIFDYPTLEKLLERNGFVDIEQVKFGSGRDPKMLIDTPEREPESLYLEASRPPV